MNKPILGALMTLFAIWNSPAAPDGGASSDAKMERKSAPKTILTKEQRHYLANYCKYRVIAVKPSSSKRERLLKRFGRTLLFFLI